MPTPDEKKRMTHKVAALVVTHDRLELLQQCLQCLWDQSMPCDVLVVDNASPHSTGKWLETEAKRRDGLHVHTMSINTGGAGGFNYGVRWATEAGYQYIWLMDDDCLPCPDALGKLLDADKTLGGPEKYGFLSSAVLWIDGNECLMNCQKPVRHPKVVSPEGLVPVEQATFVSLLVPVQTVLKVGLPISQYFIWGDDIEYTRRIAIRQERPSYLVRESHVVHAMAHNFGSNIATDDLTRMERYTLACRNESFTYRQEGLNGLIRYSGRRVRELWRILRWAPDHRLKRVKAMVKGILQGLVFHPGIESL